MLRSPGISDEEKKGISKILEQELRHEEELEEYEARLKFFINRAATIFSQMSNGLVTVLSISIGVAGVYSDPTTVALTGLIVGFSGAASTVTGFYFFNRTLRQMRIGTLSRVRMAVESAPHIFGQRVVKYMKKRELSEETAKLIAEEVSRNQDLLHRIVAEEEYGISEQALGNPFKTALYAGLFRIIGTILPLTPYFLNQPIPISIPISIIITVLLLTITGFIIALSAELDVKTKIFELTISGLVLAALTYFIGKSASILKDLMIK